MPASERCMGAVWEEFTSRRIHISLNSGKTWKVIDEGLRPATTISSIKQIGKDLLICGHPDGIFRSSDMGNTWNIVHPSVDKNEFRNIKTSNTDPSDDQRKVFTIYASGNLLYAVAGGAGLSLES